MFERPSRVIPTENEISKFTIVQSAYFNARLMGSPKVASLGGGDANWMGLTPCRIGYVAVDERRLVMGGLL